MQFVCVTIFYISVFYSYKNHLHTKHTIKLAFSEPHAQTRTHIPTQTNTFPLVLHEPLLHIIPISTLTT